MAHIRQKYKSNEIVVNNKSNFKSHLVKCQSVMDNIHFDELILKAMGKATPRAINLALQLNANNFNTFELNPKTYTVEILEDRSKKTIPVHERDKFCPDKIDDTSKKVSRIPAIEITVRKSQIEIDKIRKAQKHNKNQDPRYTFT